MDLQNLLFRFGGRINRARYWIGIAAIFAFWLVVIVIIELLPFGTSNDSPGYRPVQRSAQVISRRILGGLHHHSAEY